MRTRCAACSASRSSSSGRRTIFSVKRGAWRRFRKSCCNCWACGEQAPALEPLELERVFARAREALGPSVAPVEPVFQPAPGVRVRGDADLLVDLLYNLVQNAARARPKDGRVSIGWHTAAEGQGVDVTVRDTGCGIPAAALARVTEPFYMSG